MHFNSVYITTGIRNSPFLTDEALLSTSPAGRGQSVEMLINLEPHRIVYMYLAQTYFANLFILPLSKTVRGGGGSRCAMSFVRFKLITGGEDTLPQFLHSYVIFDKISGHTHLLFWYLYCPQKVGDIGT